MSTNSNSSESKAKSPVRIFVGGIPVKVKPKLLEKHFAQFGEVVRVVLPTPTEQQGTDVESRGYAYVLFNEQSAADKACAKKFSINGRDIQVEPAKSCGINKQKLIGQLQKKVFISKVPNYIEEKDIAKSLSCYGQVIQVKLAIKLETGVRRNFGTVTFESKDAAAKAVAQRTHMIGKRKIIIEKAEKKSNSSQLLIPESKMDQKCREMQCKVTKEVQMEELDNISRKSDLFVKKVPIKREESEEKYCKVTKTSQMSGVEEERFKSENNCHSKPKSEKMIDEQLEPQLLKHRISNQATKSLTIQVSLRPGQFFEVDISCPKTITRVIQLESEDSFFSSHLTNQANLHFRQNYVIMSDDED